MVKIAKLPVVVHTKGHNPSFLTIERIIYLGLNIFLDFSSDLDKYHLDSGEAGKKKPFTLVIVYP
jgi:hypothetical protein